MRPTVFEPQRAGYIQAFLKYREGTYASVAEHFEKVSAELNSDYTPFYRDYSDELAAEYEIDRLVYRFIYFTATLAIAIGCLGLYSLISYIAQQKTKEIGIRKVIGANTNSLMFKLSSRFVWVILIASVLATPLGYWGASQWLQSYVYSTTISPFIFVLAFVGTAVIALGSVSYRAYRAASVNPVKSLRYE